MFEWENKVDGVDDIMADDVNSLARGIIENSTNIEGLQENAESIPDTYATKEELDKAIQSAILDSWEAEI